MNGKSVSESVMRSSIADLVSRHRLIALDANVLIYLLESEGPESDRAAELIDAIEAGVVRGAFATVGLAEVLTGPARAGDGVRFELLATELRAIRNVRSVDLSAEIAADAAWIRGAGGLGLADAIHLATAKAIGATALVTNDRRIQPRAGLEVVYLSDLLAA